MNPYLYLVKKKIVEEIFLNKYQIINIYIKTNILNSIIKWNKKFFQKILDITN